MTFFAVLIGLLLFLGSYAFYFEFEFYTGTDFIMAVICASLGVLGFLSMVLAFTIL